MRWEREGSAAYGVVDRLSRLRVTVGLWRVAGVGSRRAQVLLAGLRMGCSQLGAHRCLVDTSVSSRCRCGGLESASHFLLDCRLHAAHRAPMLAAVRGVWEAAITEGVLLGDDSVRMSHQAHSVISDAVFKFVVSSGRL